MNHVHPEMFYKLYNRIENDKSDICICSHFTVDVDRNIAEHHFQDIPGVMNPSEILKMLILPMIRSRTGAQRNKV